MKKMSKYWDTFRESVVGANRQLTSIEWAFEQFFRTGSIVTLVDEIGSCTLSQPRVTR